NRYVSDRSYRPPQSQTWRGLRRRHARSCRESTSSGGVPDTVFARLRARLHSTQLALARRLRAGVLAARHSCLPLPRHPLGGPWAIPHHALSQVLTRVPPLGRFLMCSQTLEITTEPSPTAEATRLTEPARTSPTAKMPGWEVAN